MAKRQTESHRFTGWVDLILIRVDRIPITHMHSHIDRTARNIITKHRLG